MRITAKMAVNTLVNNLDRSYGRMTQYQTQLSSGSRINRLSDDPAAVERTLALRSELRNIEQFGRNISDGKGWLEVSEAALDEMETLFVEATGLAVQGSSSTYNASQRITIADQIDQFIELALSLSETQIRGQHIFSGTQTNQTPYSARRDETGRIVEIVANGNAGGSIERQIGEGVVVQVNVPGSDVFGSASSLAGAKISTLLSGLEAADAQALTAAFADETGQDVDDQDIIGLDIMNSVLTNDTTDSPLSAAVITQLEEGIQEVEKSQANPFSALLDLRDALRDDDIVGVRDTFSKLSTVRENISSTRGLIGARVNRMQTTQHVLDRVAVEMTSVLTEDEGVDLSATIVNLTQEQDVFQAALASGGTIIPQSLMDFI
ncbi:MAG: flagellar hook-associated protein FlgL [Candidatus Latescibacterota bacterium]|nr:flagellar hook-associated protein FlgL [Candidatus Latescibacterota bacterium]